MTHHRTIALLYMATCVATSGCRNDPDRVAMLRDAGAGGAGAPDSSSSGGYTHGYTASGGGAGTGGSTASPSKTEVSLRFEARVGPEPFRCGKTYEGLGATHEDVEPADLRFYVQSVSLLTSAGDAVPVELAKRLPWQIPQVALLDFEDGSGACVNGEPTMNSVVTGLVPRGSYTGLSFVIGVPEALNHLPENLWPPPLQAGGMTWSWLAGFKFFVAEVTLVPPRAPTSPEAGPPGGLFHVGSTECGSGDGGPMRCARPNRAEIRFPAFDVATDRIVLDVAKVFDAVDLSTGVTCHSEGTSCPVLFRGLGLDFMTGTLDGPQRVFSVE